MEDLEASYHDLAHVNDEAPLKPGFELLRDFLVPATPWDVNSCPDIVAIRRPASASVFKVRVLPAIFVEEVCHYTAAYDVLHAWAKLLLCIIAVVVVAKSVRLPTFFCHMTSFDFDLKL